MVFLYILSMFGFKPLLVITVVLLGWVSSRSIERGMFYQFQNQNDLCVCIRNGLPANQGYRKILVDTLTKDYWNQQSERFLKFKEILQNLINKYLFGINSDEVNFLDILNMPQELSELNEENILNNLDTETNNSPEDGVEPSEQRKMLTTSGSEPNSDKPNDLTNESRFVWYGPEQASHRLNNYPEFSNQQYPLKLSQFGSIPLNDFPMELDNIPRQPYETVYPLNSKPSELVNSGYPVNPNPYITWSGNGNFINPQSSIRLYGDSKQYPELQNLPETYQDEAVPLFKPSKSPEGIQSGFSPLSENPSDDPNLNKGAAMITNEPLQNFPRQRLIEDDEYSYPNINYKLQQKKPMFHSGGSQPSSQPEEPINPNDEYKWVSDPIYDPQKKPMPSYPYFPERRRYEGLPFGTRDELKQDLTYLVPEQQEIEYLSDKEEAKINYDKWSRLEPDYPIRQPERRTHTSLDIYAQPNPEDLETENVYTKQQNFPSDMYDYQPNNKPKERQPNQAKPTNSGVYEIQDVPYGAVDTFPVEEQITEELELPEEKKPIQMNPNNLGVQKVKSPKSRKNIGAVSAETSNEYLKWPRLESTYPFRQPNQGRHTSLDVYVQPNPEDLEIENIYTKQQNFPSDIYDYQPKNKPKERQPNQAKPTNSGEYEIQDVPYGAVDTYPVEEQITEELELPEGKKPIQMNPDNLGVQRVKSPKSRKNIGAVPEETSNEYPKWPRLESTYPFRQPNQGRHTSLDIYVQPNPEDLEIENVYTKQQNFPSDIDYQSKRYKPKERQPNQAQPTNLGDQDIQNISFDVNDESHIEEHISEELKTPKKRQPNQVEPINLGVQKGKSPKSRKNRIPVSSDLPDNYMFQKPRMKPRYQTRKPRNKQPSNLGFQTQQISEEPKIDYYFTELSPSDDYVYNYQPKTHKRKNRKPKQVKPKPSNLGDEIQSVPYERINFSPEEEQIFEELQIIKDRKPVQVESNNLGVQGITSIKNRRNMVTDTDDNLILQSRYPNRQPKQEQPLNLGLQVEPVSEELMIEDLATQPQMESSDIFGYQPKRYKPRNKKPKQNQPINLGEIDFSKEDSSEELEANEVRKSVQVEPNNLNLQSSSVMYDSQEPTYKFPQDDVQEDINYDFKVGTDNLKDQESHQSVNGFGQISLGDIKSIHGSGQEQLHSFQEIEKLQGIPDLHNFKDFQNIEKLTKDGIPKTIKFGHNLSTRTIYTDVPQVSKIQWKQTVPIGFKMIQSSSSGPIKYTQRSTTKIIPNLEQEPLSNESIETIQNGNGFRKTIKRVTIGQKRKMNSQRGGMSFSGRKSFVFGSSGDFPTGIMRKRVGQITEGIPM